METTSGSVGPDRKPLPVDEEEESTTSRRENVAQLIWVPEIKCRRRDCFPLPVTPESRSPTEGDWMPKTASIALETSSDSGEKSLVRRSSCDLYTAGEKALGGGAGTIQGEMVRSRESRASFERELRKRTAWLGKVGP